MSLEAVKLVRQDCAGVAFDITKLEALRGGYLLITGGTGFMGIWLTELLTYLNDVRNNKISLIFRFFLVYGITYSVNLLALNRFKAVDFNMLAAGAIMLVPTAILSYFLNKKLVFRDIRAESDLRGDK